MSERIIYERMKGKLIYIFFITSLRRLKRHANFVWYCLYTEKSKRTEGHRYLRKATCLDPCFLSWTLWLKFLYLDKKKIDTSRFISIIIEKKNQVVMYIENKYLLQINAFLFFLLVHYCLYLIYFRRAHRFVLSLSM